MTKKVIPKKLLDTCINADREYWSYDHNHYDTISLFKELDAATGIDWYAMQCLMTALLTYRGLKRNATNEDIYAILRLLGWEVSD